MNEAENKKESFIKDIVKFTVVALIIIVPVRMYVAQPFVVSGASMDPTFESGQYLIVDQFTYHVRDPERGDVVIFKYPRNPETFFIKRIVGLPGESLSIDEGKITIKNEEYPDGFTLDEEYIDEEHKTYDNISVILGSDEYYVMGDNRPQSSDSRIWGPLEEKYIVGRPIVRLYPITTIGVLPGKE